MKQFKDLGIATLAIPFAGEKIKINKLLNREIIVQDFKIEESKFEGKGKRLCLQILVDDTQRIVFTGSKGLMDQVQMVSKEDFPFAAKIIEEEGGRFLFQ